MSIRVTPIPKLIEMADPAFTLGTANAAGSAATAVASDSTLLVFDTTLPDAITFGQSGAAGSSTTAARRSHEHPMAALDVPLTAIDIDGGTDIGAAIVDADLFIIDDNAGGTNRKTAASRIATYIASAVTRAGGQATEGTTSSTSAVNLLTASSLTIAANQPFHLIVDGRKTSGAVVEAHLGVTINSTIVGAPASGGLANTWRSKDTNEDQQGGAIQHFGARVTNYQTCIIGTTRALNDSGANSESGNNATNTAVVPIATVTDVITSGNAGNASITLGADELQVYGFSVS
jgi:hypothetical protein